MSWDICCSGRKRNKQTRKETNKAFRNVSGFIPLHHAVKKRASSEPPPLKTSHVKKGLSFGKSDGGVTLCMVCGAKAHFKQIATYLQAFSCIVVVIICERTFTNILDLPEMKRATEPKKTLAIFTHLCMSQTARLRAHTDRNTCKSTSKRSWRPALS